MGHAPRRYRRGARLTARHGNAASHESLPPASRWRRASPVDAPTPPVRAGSARICVQCLISRSERAYAAVIAKRNCAVAPRYCTRARPVCATTVGISGALRSALPANCVVARRRRPLPSCGRLISGTPGELSKKCPRIQAPSLLESWRSHGVQESFGRSKTPCYQGFRNSGL